MSVSPDGRQVSDLEEMCLSVITANFGKYCIALKRSSDRSALRRNWESVARRFSETLFERLKSEMELTAEHLDFLINPYVKELDLVGIERTLPAVLIDKLKTYGKNILSLKARTSELENSLYKPLMASLPNVENMEFTTFWDPEILKPIGRNCPFLKVLLLEREDVLYGRTELDIKGKRKLRDGISFIMTQCPCLEVFDFSDTIGVLYKMHKSHLDFTRQKSSLRNFLRPKKSSTEIKKYALRTLASRKRNYPLCDALEICHIFCPNASSIDIDHVSCDEELEKISHFALLEDVKLDAMHDVSPSCLSEFLTLRGCKLVRLEMSHVSCLSVLTLIESCPKLQSLKLRSLVCPDSSGEKEGLSLPDLKTLEYSDCSFRDPEISEALKLILSSAQRILSLSLTESSGLTNELVSSLDLNHIHELDVSSSDVAAKPLRYLLLHGKLQKLNVENCRQITYDDYFVLTECLPDGRRTVVDINWCFPDIHEQVYCVPAYQP